MRVKTQITHIFLTNGDLYRKIIRKSSDLNGVYSAEHGTGKRKTIDFLECYGEEAAKQVRECKRAFDPNSILNIGNIIDIGEYV